MELPVADIFDAGTRLLEADSTRDHILISSKIHRDLHVKLSRLLDEKKAHDSCTIYMTTRGGDPNAGYRIARCLRHHYDHVRLVVPSLCKSAGTLIAIGADDLAIGDLGELGPLDIQVNKPSELEENNSGLDIMQAMQTVVSEARNVFYQTLIESRTMRLSTRMCAEFGSQLATGVLTPLLNQIDPMRMGEMQRATRVAYEYGERLNTYRRNLKEGALDRLVSSYPSHGFVIDRKEARELFNRVFGLTRHEQQFCEDLWWAFHEQGSYDPRRFQV